MAKRIYVVFKTHFDIGFTELVSELFHRWNVSMFPDVCDVCDATSDWGPGRRYTWTMPSWPLYRILNGLAEDPALAERIGGLVRDGQIRWHALPFTTHTEFCGLEEYIRGLTFSQRLAAEYGAETVCAKMTDVVGHTWILPSILAKAGVKFLHLGPNQACKLPDVPGLFYWEGPDGGRLLVFYNKQGGYGSSLTPPEDWPFPVWLALMQTNDNCGPQRPEDIGWLLEAIERDAPGSEVIIGGLDDFYNALPEYLPADIPVVKTDIADTWIHGTGTMPREVGRLRGLRHRLTDAEKALNLLSVLCPGGFDADAAQKHIENAYEQSLLFGEHTWGLTTFGVPYISYERWYRKEDLHKNGDIARFEASWDEHRDYFYRADKETAEVYPGIMDSLAASLPVCGERLAVFSGLGWGRSAWVDIGALGDKAADKIFIDAISGDVLETARFGGRPHLYVTGLPPFGYRAVVMSDGRPAPEPAAAGKNLETSAVAGEIPGTASELDAATKIPKAAVIADAKLGLLENQFFSITADRSTGTISSLLDKRTGREWAGQQDGRGFGQYQYDVYGEEDATKFLLDTTSRFYDWQVCSLVRKEYFGLEHLTAFPSGFTATETTEDHCASLTLAADISGESVSAYGDARHIGVTVTLYGDDPYIDIAYALRGKEKTFRVESGNFVFPLNISNPEYRVNKTGSVIDPASDIVEGGNHALFCCENWADVSDGKDGLAFIPYDTPLFSIGTSGVLKVRRTFDPEKPTLMFNAFNNSYGCNFPQWMGGDYSFRFRLIPHRGDWREGNIQRLAFESVMPALFGYAGQTEGKSALPASFSLMEPIEGMQVMALKMAEDRGGYVLRLREINGKARRVKLALNGKFGCASPCDLSEKICGEPFPRADEIVFDTKPFEIHSFYIK
ncbi:MAG: glycosyl hydrolase-related protein [Defluviitaleaceae bacterium]|nr:glycosyl hydrolase-related protein [Defluviitaleaceae bacterium]